MEKDRNIIFVTWDFTEKSEFALQHAIRVSEYLKHYIALVHIVKKESEIRQAEQKMNDIIAAKYSDIRDKVEIIVEEGSIFNTITEIANNINPRMIFMGTHGIRGMQKVWGSWALKVIAHTRVPFVVVQAPPKDEANIYKSIVMPVNYRKENKESINWAVFFSKYFKSTFKIFMAKHTDPNFIKGVESNKYFLNKYFQSKGINYTLDETPGETDFMKEVLDFANNENSDAIMIMVTRDIGFADYMLGAHEQYIIANPDKIPVICINPRPPKIGGSFSTSGS
jgi:nucleotide-binding universal stress UspA family protein